MARHVSFSYLNSKIMYYFICSVKFPLSIWDIRPQCFICKEAVNVFRDPSLWEPLVKDREIVPWLVQRPTAEEQSRARALSQQQINLLEELWKSRAEATLEDVQRGGGEQEAAHVLLRSASAALCFLFAFEFLSLISLLRSILSCSPSSIFKNILNIFKFFFI